jgi:DNA polymerase III subunit epsilon
MAGTWRTTVAGLAASGGALAWLGMESIARAGNDWWGQMAAVAALLGGFAGILLAFGRLVRHFRLLDDLTRELHGGALRLTSAVGGRPSEEIGRLAAAFEARLHPRGAPFMAGSAEARALAAAVEDPVLIVDGAGVITLSNAAALRQLGVGAETGRSAGALFQEAEWAHAVERARAANGPVPVTLHRGGIAEVSGKLSVLGAADSVALVLARPVKAVAATVAASPRPADDEPVATLPLMAVWAAASDPNPAAGRLIAFGCLRLSGARVFRTMSLDLLVDPGVPVPAEAAARHGLSDRDVAGARTFAACWPDIERMLRGCVLIGVGVTAVSDLLRCEAERAGIGAIPDYPLFELPALAAAVDGGPARRDAARLCADYAVDPPARFGTFAPVHAVAEVAARVVQRLPERGIATFAAAQAVSAGAVVEPGVDGEGGAEAQQHR